MNCIVCGMVATEAGIDRHGMPKRIPEFCYDCKQKVKGDGAHLVALGNGQHMIDKAQAPQASYHPYFPIYT